MLESNRRKSLTGFQRRAQQPIAEGVVIYARISYPAYIYIYTEIYAAIAYLRLSVSITDSLILSLFLIPIERF